MANLSLQHLIKNYGGRRVVNDVSLDVNSGEVVGLLGPNGAGKTTTFYMAIGMIRPDAGAICIDEEDISQLPMHLRARKGIGYLPQETSIFRKLTVRDNILAVLELTSASEEQRRMRTDRALDELGIRHLSGSRASVLSGGEKRRLEISRTLALDPLFILLDEPFAGIDPLAVLDIRNIIGQLRDKGIGVVISDHNVRETLGVCDRAYILNEGKLLESGAPEKIAASETARKFYLGEEFRL